MARDERVVLFIDYENMHRCARDEYGLSAGHFSPWRLGELLVGRRNRRPTAPFSVLHQVRVYRGLPDSRLQPTANAANQAQEKAWEAEVPSPGYIEVYQRPLRYPKGWPESGKQAQEKGVDVALAVDLLRMTYQGAYDVAIVCSHDTDLSPALDAANGVGTTRHHIEVASWSRRRRISFSHDNDLPWCHRLKQADFDVVKDLTDYRSNT